MYKVLADCITIGRKKFTFGMEISGSHYSKEILQELVDMKSIEAIEVSKSKVKKETEKKDSQTEKPINPEFE